MRWFVLVVLLVVAGCASFDGVDRDVPPPPVPPLPPGSVGSSGSGSLTGAAALSPLDFVGTPLFAPPYDVFHANHPLLGVVPEGVVVGTPVFVKVDHSANDVKLTYEIAFVKNDNNPWDEEWMPFILSGTSSDYPGFLVGSVLSQIPDSLVVEGLSYVAVFICTATVRDASGQMQYACACQNPDYSTCQKWNLQRFLVVGSSEQLPGGLSGSQPGLVGGDCVVPEDCPPCAPEEIQLCVASRCACGEAPAESTLHVKAEYFMDEVPPRARLLFPDLELGQRFAVHVGGAGGPLYEPAFDVPDTRRYVGGWPHQYDWKWSESLRMEYPTINGIQGSVPHYIAEDTSGWVDYLMYMPGTYGFEVTSQNHGRVEIYPRDFPYWAPHTRYAENEFIIYLEEVTQENFFTEVALVRAALYDENDNPVVVRDEHLVPFSGGYAYAFATTEDEITVKYTPVLNSRVQDYSLEAERFNRYALYTNENLVMPITHTYDAGDALDYLVWIGASTEHGQSAVWNVILNYQPPPETDPLYQPGTTGTLETSWVPANMQVLSRSIVYTGNDFLGVHVGGVERSSSGTGASWSPVSGAPTGLTHVAYGDGLFVAIGNGKSAVSTDGRTWTVHAQPSFTAFTDLFFGGGAFVAVNQGLSGTVAVFASQNGKDWTSLTGTLPAGFRPRKGAYGNGVYVLVGGEDIVFGSALEQWTMLRCAEWCTDKTGVTFGNGQFVVVTRTKPGSNAANQGKNIGNIMTSSDGQSWTIQTTPNSDETQFHTGAIAYGDGRFVAIGNDAGALGSVGSHVIHSTDGQTWNSENIFNNAFVALAYGNGRFITSGGTANLQDGRTVRNYPLLRSY